MAQINTRWNPFFKYFVIVITFVGAVWLLSRVTLVLAPLIIALLLAYLVSLPVGWVLRRTGWPRTPVVLVTELIVILVLLTVPALITPWLVGAVGAFGNTLVSVIQGLLEATPKPITLPAGIQIDLGAYYQPINEWLRGMFGPDLNTIRNLQNWLGPVASGAAGVLRGAVSGIVWAIFVLVVSFYVVRDGSRLAQFVAKNVPEPWRPELGRLWHELVRIWDAFVRGQLILALIVGFVVWLSMSILGLRNAPILGLISGLLEFVPAIGPVVAGIPGVTIALVLGSSWLPLPHIWFAIIVALTYFLIQQLENIYLLPRVVGSRVNLHPAVVIVGALTGAQLGGVLGILLAAPTIAALRTLAGYTWNRLLDQEPFPEVPPPPDRAVVWPGLVQERDVVALLFDLDGTLIETDDELVQKMSDRLRFLDRLLPEQRRRSLARRWVMNSEVFVNGLVTVLDRLHLDGPLFRWEARLHRLAGFRPQQQFTAVAGTNDALRALARRYRLAIVTSRSRADAAAFLAQFNLSGQIATVVTRNDVRRLKPHPEPVNLAAKRLGVPVGRCVMVGDTSVDVRAGKAAGALTLGVLCGFGEENDLTNAELVLASTAELPAWL